MNNKTNNKKHQRILQVQKKNDNDDKKRTLAVAVLTRNKCKEVVVVVAVETISKYWRYRFRRNSLWILVKASMDAGFTMENMDKLR